MFQFRRFPTYTYLIQCTLTEYCSAGFPHSDIHGSMRMCRSPWLFAACHVLLRLLMPRHPPCALFRLTSSPHTLICGSALVCSCSLRIMQAFQRVFQNCSVTLLFHFYLAASLSGRLPSVALLILVHIVQFSRCRKRIHTGCTL